MSYDIDIEHQSIKVAREAGGLETEIGNYTYNCGSMFREASGGKGLSDLNGMNCKQAGYIVDFVLDNFAKDPEKYRAMNPENGWGNFDSFREYIQKLGDACKKYPHSRVVVS